MACGCVGCGPSLSRRAVLRGVAATAPVALAGCDLADSRWLADLLVPPSVEEELGEAAFREILARERLAADPALQRRVAAIGGRIVAAAGGSPAAWQFVVLDSPQPNAFALPGGRVGVYTGMLQITADEAQLATVLGHEVGHVLARHAAQRILAEHAVTLALRVAASLLAVSDIEVPPDLVVALGASVADLGVIRPFSRSQELEADRLGLGYMAAAGYDPAESIAFWRRMAALDLGSPPAFVSTHPSSEARIEQLESLTRELRRRVGPAA